MFRFVPLCSSRVRYPKPPVEDARQLLGDQIEPRALALLLVDVSPSMAARLSAKSDLSRMDAAFALAILLRGICERVRVFAFSSETREVPARSGMALADAIKTAVPSDATLLGRAVAHVAKAAPKADRLIVITDEESQDMVGKPHCSGYMLNVSTSQNGVGYGNWLHITGFSESVVSYISALERSRTRPPEP